MKPILILLIFSALTSVPLFIESSKRTFYIVKDFINFAKEGFIPEHYFITIEEGGKEQNQEDSEDILWKKRIAYEEFLRLKSKTAALSVLTTMNNAFVLSITIYFIFYLCKS